MPEPGDIDLSSLSEEADRLLTGLSDASSTPKSRTESGSAPTGQVTTQLGESDTGKSSNPGSTESDDKNLLFAAAVSELRRQGTLKTGGLPPSLERSRATMSSFVVCDTQARVIGRVALSLLHSRIKQKRTSIPNNQPLTHVVSAPVTHQKSDISTTSLDRAILQFINDCSPEERVMFMSEYNARRKSVASGVILALLFGGLGIHKFWLGNVAIGLLYLAFCWTFIPGIVALLDACLMGNSVQKHNAQVASAAFQKIVMRR